MPHPDTDDRASDDESSGASTRLASPGGTWLETRIPPPVVMLLLAAGMWAFASQTTVSGFDLPRADAIAAAVAVAGLMLNLWPKHLFGRAATTVNPMRPGNSTCLVTTGVYRLTRNPMYLGHALMLLGWGLHLENAIALSAVPMYALYITRFQIRAEERVLGIRFPLAYATYRTRVRRWL